MGKVWLLYCRWLIKLIVPGELIVSGEVICTCRHCRILNGCLLGQMTHSSLAHVNLSGPGLYTRACSVALYRIALFCMVVLCGG